MARFFRRLAPAFLTIVFVLLHPLQAIIVDGNPLDWSAEAISVTDPLADGQSSGADFQKLSITNDAYNLYLLVEFEDPVNLRFADLRLYIDADNNASTGTPLSGRGMDFSWDFDRNRGTSTLTDRGEIGRGNLIERLAPDGLSTIHEIAVSLEALPAVRSGEPVHIALVEENSFDRIPDLGTTLAYRTTGPLSVQPMPILTRKSPRSVRIMSWNVWRDAPFEGNNLDRFRRVVEAINPDIAILQEIYDTPTSTVLDFFQDNLQLPTGYEWSIARQRDCITVSRFPIEGSWASDGNLVSRHETESSLGYQLLIVNAHLPCCTNGEDGRISEGAKLLGILNDRYRDQTSAPQSIIIGGDLNSGGLAPELIDLTTTLMPLEMASPRHVYQYDQYTWGSLGSSFGSSKLDFLLFDPATLFRHKAFTLDTDLLPQSALSAMGLQATDTFVSDHLPLVLDLSSRRLPARLQANPMAANGDCVSDWWGKLNGFIYPVVLHERIGWLRLYESGNGGLWYADADGSWFWTSPQVWPWFYSVDGAEWKYDHLHT